MATITFNFPELATPRTVTIDNENLIDIATCYSINPAAYATQEDAMNALINAMIGCLKKTIIQYRRHNSITTITADDLIGE